MKIRKVPSPLERKNLRKQAREKKRINKAIMEAKATIKKIEGSVAKLKKTITKINSQKKSSQPKQTKKRGDKAHWQLNRRQKDFRTRAKKFFQNLDSKNLKSFLAFYEEYKEESAASSTKRIKTDIYNERLYVTFIKRRKKGYATIVAIQKGNNNCVLGTYRLFSSVKRTKNYLYLLEVTNDLLNNFKKA
jgi:hypothetical protein